MIKQLSLVVCFCTGFLCLHAQDMSDPAYQEVPAELLADRLQCIEQSIPLHFNKKVQAFIRYFTRKDRPYTQGVVDRQEQYFPLFEKILAEEGMPDELKYLAVVESGLRPRAISRAGAAGLWQFMPATGKRYGLHQSWYIDERMNPWQATRAACKYLKALYHMFGSWELAMAAYNTGPGNVRKAIRRSGYRRGFWEIYKYLPRETRSYLPQFVAIAYTLNYLTAHQFDTTGMTTTQLPLSDTIQVSHYVHLETLAQQIHLPVDDLMVLNPQIIRGAVPDGVQNYPIKVPKSLAQHIRDHKKDLLDSASKVGKKELAYLARNTPGSTYGRTRQVYKVRSGDVLGAIAVRYHVRVSDIKRWNRLSSHLIRVGQRLNIWTLPHYSTKNKAAYTVKNLPQKSAQKAVPGGTYHLVKSGDSLWNISRMYKDTSIEQIKKLNNLRTSRINPGQKLLIKI